MTMVTSPSRRSASPLPEFTRFIGLDLSKRSLVTAAVDLKQHIVLQPTKVTLERFESWAAQNLKFTDRVVIEASGNACAITTC